MMEFDRYQERIIGFMNPKVMEDNHDMLMNAVLGMCGEAGETADLVKKWLFHDAELDLDKLDKEVGDQLFYIALYCNARKVLMSGIAQKNIDKLTARYENKPWSAEAAKAKRDQVEPTDYSEREFIRDECPGDDE